jgi:hypothetical protein
MTNLAQQVKSRREFLRRAARGAALVLALAGTAYATRPRTFASAACRQAGPCQGCAVLSDCQRPAAQRSRRETQGGTR